MTGRDYYELLGVRRDASVDELKRAYEVTLSRASRDGATKHMVDVVKAYEVLSHPGRRAFYDQTGHGVVPERVPNTYGRAVPFRGGRAALGQRRHAPPAPNILPTGRRAFPMATALRVALVVALVAGAFVAGSVLTG